MLNWSQFNEGLFLSKEEWKDKMIELIKKEGAIKKDKFANWDLDTKFGILNIRFDVDDGYPSIFMKFEEPERSKELYDVNKNSGKWNLFDNNIQNLYLTFKRRIDEVKLTPMERTAKKYNI